MKDIWIQKFVLRYTSKVTSHLLATYRLATRMLDTLNSINLERLLRDKTLEGLLIYRYLHSHKPRITRDVCSRFIIRTVRYALNRIILGHAHKQWHVLQCSRSTDLSASVLLVLQFVSRISFIILLFVTGKEGNPTKEQWT